LRHPGTCKRSAFFSLLSLFPRCSGERGIPFVWRRILPALDLLLLFSLVFWGCGKKANPVAPESTMPAAVADLRAWPREGAVFLGWSLPTRNTDGSALRDLLGFRVFRQSRPLTPSSCPDCPLDFQVVAEIDVEYPRGAQVEGGRVLWPDTSVKPQQEYTYLVLAYNSYKSPSPESNRVKIFWDQAPPAPVEVRIKSEDRALEITWEFSLPPGKEPADFSGFNLYRRMEGERFGFYPLNPDPIKQARFVDGGLENGRRYGYEVRAVRNFRGTLIEGPASGVVEGIPKKQTPPSPPTGLVAVFHAGGVALRWNGSPEPDIAGYDVYRREEGTQTFQKISPQSVKEPYFLDRTASPLKSYFYRLKAVDSSGKESEFSQEAEVLPEPTTPTK
jgi:hypothetical protein